MPKRNYPYCMSLQQIMECNRTGQAKGERKAKVAFSQGKNKAQSVPKESLFSLKRKIHGRTDRMSSGEQTIRRLAKRIQRDLTKVGKSISLTEAKGLLFKDEE